MFTMRRRPRLSAISTRKVVDLALSLASTLPLPLSLLLPLLLPLPLLLLLLLLLLLRALVPSTAALRCCSAIAAFASCAASRAFQAA